LTASAAIDRFGQPPGCKDKLMGTYIPYIQEDEKADKAN
jgi:hypothetical protein